jgi:molybdate transport system regulatory protein
MAAGTYNGAMVNDMLQVRLLLGAPANLGPGKIRLLQAVAETGSISGAARRMKISYRRAWLMIDTLNKGFPSVLVEANAGGDRGGGARLTERGHAVLEQYLRLQAQAERALAGEADCLLRLAGQT